MKVVHVIEALGGGVYTYFRDLSFYFGDEEIKKDVETIIIYSGNRKEIDPAKIKDDFSKGVQLILVDMVANLSPLKDLKSIINLKRELKEINPDIIHLHSSKAGVLGKLAVFFLFKKKKVFYSPHGYSFLRADISKTSKKFYWLIEKSFQIIFGGTIVACGDTELELAKRIGKSTLIRNGINVAEINKNYCENNNDVLTVGIVARITFARNPKMFNKIAENFPNINFVWIGDGDLRHQISSPNIRVTGWMLNRADVIREINLIDVYIQTSLWEGLPIAVLEAMAMQKPIIATNIIGNKDVVVHNETGFLFDDINELENYFNQLKSETKRKEMGLNGLKRCQDLFDKDKNFNKLVSLYNL